MRTVRNLALWVGLLAGVFGLAEIALGQQSPEVEVYRLRVENALYGRVEASVNRGQTYHLLGRVMQPAHTLTLDKTATASGKVVRSGREGIAFSVGVGTLLKLRPGNEGVLPSGKGRTAGQKAPPLPKESSALITNLAAGQSVFATLAPPFGASVRLQTSPHALNDFPRSYLPGEGDEYVFVVSQPAGANETENAARQEMVRLRIEAAAQTYASGAIARARAARLPIADGTLTLRAKLPEGEPEPIVAVSYLLDGSLVAIQNTEPFSYAWNTRETPDGEHVIEIRALNRTGGQVTRIRKLVVVANQKALGIGR